MENAWRGMEDNSFTAVVTDPPYALEFMGRDWDRVIPGVDIWKEALRVTKPGGFLMAFGGIEMGEEYVRIAERRLDELPE